MDSPVKRNVRALLPQYVVEHVLTRGAELAPLFCESCCRHAGTVVTPPISTGNGYQYEFTLKGVVGGPYIFHCKDYLCWYRRELAEQLNITYDITDDES